MNRDFIEKWNKRVGYEDKIYFLGDLSFGGPNRTEEVLCQLNGNKEWILGNHDEHNGVPERLTKYFTWVGLYKTITINNQYIVLMHYPLLEWDRAHKGSWHLHGHCHNNLPPTTLPRIDVGVDAFPDGPVSFEEIAKIMQSRSWESSSHH